MIEKDAEQLMAQEIRLNCIYMDSETRSRFDLACEELGWASKGLVTQCIQAYFKVNKDYYIEAALSDAKARGMAETDYYRILRDASEDDLNPYIAGRPAFGGTPLDPVPAVSTGEDNRKRYNTLTLSSYNLVLLRVARIVDMGPLVQVVSRIVKQHFDRYWESNYAPQIDLDKACTFK